MDDILILLGKEVNKDQVEVIYKLIKTRLLNICKGYDNKLLSIPENLEYILTEATIERYNTIGAENMQEESFENYRAKYITSDILEKYIPAIDRYFDSIDENKNINANKVRFIWDMTT